MPGSISPMSSANSNDLLMPMRPTGASSRCSRSTSEPSTTSPTCFLFSERKTEAAEAFHYLGNALQDAGRTSAAAQAYQQSIAIVPNAGVEVKLSFLTPVIPMSVEEIDRTRERLFAGISALTAKGIRLDDPLRYASSALFYTGYHGRNDRELRRQFADFYLTASPHLAWRAPHCENYVGGGERLRIGFISRNFHPEHPMTKLYGGIIEHLDRRRFDVTLFRFDPATTQPLPETRVTVLGNDLEAARGSIAQARLDVLFYTDIGMEPTTYFLAFSRLARCMRHVRPSGDDRHCQRRLLPFRAGNGNQRRAGSLHRDADPAVDGTDLLQAAVRLRHPADACGSGAARGSEALFLRTEPDQVPPRFDAVLARILQRDPKAAARADQQ